MSWGDTHGTLRGSLYFVAPPSTMPILYTPKQLLHGEVPTVSTIRGLPFLIQDALEAMLNAGEIVGATSFGSLFVPEAPVTCASDIDWFIIFSETRHMLESQHWRVLQGELSRRHVQFYTASLAMEHVRTGNHTLCSLLHGVKQADQRLITGKDPLEIVRMHGGTQNSVERTLQLFSSFTRFFFENYVNLYDLHNTYDGAVRLLTEMVSLWKDIIASMIVATLPEDGALPVRWSVYEQLYAHRFSRDVLAGGACVAKFLEDVRERMERYDQLRNSGAALQPFCEEHAAFLAKSLELIPMAAHFAEVNISMYRTWARALPGRRRKRLSSQATRYVYNG